MLDAAGIKARVCNVYYSGCPLENHWNWWKSGEAHYDFYVTDENGRVGTKGVNLEYCLQQGNWDIISLQESTHKIRNGGGVNHFATTQTYLTDLWGYIKEQFPHSRYFWHQPWAYQVGSDKNGIQMTDLFKRLNELMPQALEIGRMRQLGMSDTAISAEIGIPRKTFTDRLKRAKDILKSEFPDIF